MLFRDKTSQPLDLTAAMVSNSRGEVAPSDARRLIENQHIKPSNVRVLFNL